MAGPVCYCNTCKRHFIAGGAYSHIDHDAKQCRQEDYDEPLEDD